MKNYSFLSLPFVAIFMCMSIIFISCGKDKDPITPNEPTPQDTVPQDKKSSWANYCEYEIFETDIYGTEDILGGKWTYNKNKDVIAMYLYNNDSTAGYRPQVCFYFYASRLKDGSFSSQAGDIIVGILWTETNDSIVLSNINLSIESTGEIDHYKITASYNANGDVQSVEYTGFCDNYKFYGNESYVKTNKTFTFSDAQYVARTAENYRWVDVYFDENSMLQFWVNVDENTVIPVGTYNITNTYETGTSTASFGSLPTIQPALGSIEWLYYPDFIIDDANNLVWFLRKGTIEVKLVENTTKSVSITGHATSYYGSTINFNFEGRILQYSSSSSAPKKINRQMRRTNTDKRKISVFNLKK